MPKLKIPGKGQKPRRDKKENKGQSGDSNSEHESSSDSSTVSSFSITGTYNSERFSIAKCRVEQLFQALDDVSEKSSELRVRGLQSTCEVLTHLYMPDFVENHKYTLIGFIKKAIRQDKTAEKVWAAHLVPLVLLQLDDITQIAEELNQPLRAVLQDGMAPCEARSKCCRALGVLNFLGGEEIGELLSFMQFFETIFSGMCLEATNKELGILQAEAIYAWGLLLTLVPAEAFVTNTKSRMAENFGTGVEQMMVLLHSRYLEVRVAAGKTLAQVFESARSYDNNFLHEFCENTIRRVKDLATDSNKFLTKRNLKGQRAVFRDVLRYFEEGKSPEQIIHFGTEYLVLDTWAICQQYARLRTVLGPGMTSHLQKNHLIRDIFEIADVGYNEAKLLKPKRQRMNATAFKERTISRRMQRDKRSVNFDF